MVHSKIVGTVCGGETQRRLGGFMWRVGCVVVVVVVRVRRTRGCCQASGEKSGRSSNLNFPPFFAVTGPFSVPNPPLGYADAEGKSC